MNRQFRFIMRCNIPDKPLLFSSSVFITQFLFMHSKSRKPALKTPRLLSHLITQPTSMSDMDPSPESIADINGRLQNILRAAAFVSPWTVAWTPSVGGELPTIYRCRSAYEQTLLESKVDYWASKRDLAHNQFSRGEDAKLLQTLQNIDIDFEGAWSAKIEHMHVEPLSAVTARAPGTVCLKIQFGKGNATCRSTAAYNVRRFSMEGIVFVYSVLFQGLEMVVQECEQNEEEKSADDLLIAAGGTFNAEQSDASKWPLSVQTACNALTFSHTS